MDELFGRRFAREAQRQDAIHFFTYHIDRRSFFELESHLAGLNMGSEVSFLTAFLTALGFWSVFGLTCSLMVAWNVGGIRKVDRYNCLKLLVWASSLSCSRSVWEKVPR
ncbi:hypothetical protein CC79DRAFT_1336581 [Sarocladium strictum]